MIQQSGGSCVYLGVIISLCTGLSSSAYVVGIKR